MLYIFSGLGLVLIFGLLQFYFERVYFCLFICESSGLDLHDEALFRAQGTRDSATVLLRPGESVIRTLGTLKEPEHYENRVLPLAALKAKRNSGDSERSPFEPGAPRHPSGELEVIQRISIITATDRAFTHCVLSFLFCINSFPPHLPDAVEGMTKKKVKPKWGRPRAARMEPVPTVNLTPRCP